MKKRFWKDRSKLIRLFGTLLSLFLLYFYVRKQDWDQLMAAAFSISIPTILVVLFFFFLVQLFNSIRWWMLLRSVQIPLAFGHVFRLSLISIFSSNFLPSTIGGDLVRLLAVSVNVEKKEEAAASVIIDRLLGLISRLVLLPLSLPLLVSASPEFLHAVSPVLLPGRTWIEKLKNQLKKIVGAFGFWLKHPQTLLSALLISWIGLTIYICGIWLVARELDIQVTVLNVAAVMGVTYFITLLPISLNGLGLRELGMVTLYAFYGATLEQATALAVITRVLVMMVSLLGALFIGSEMETINNHLSDS